MAKKKRRNTRRAPKRDVDALDRMDSKPYQILRQAFLDWVRLVQDRDPTKLPTLRDAGAMFGLTYDAVERLADDCENLSINTGVRIGSGVADLARYEWTFELDTNPTYGGTNA